MLPQRPEQVACIGALTNSLECIGYLPGAWYGATPDK